MKQNIVQLAAKCPFSNNKDTFYLSSNTESFLLLMDLSTGTINRMGTVSDDKRYIGNYESDTCNSESDTCFTEDNDTYINKSNHNENSDKQNTGLVLPNHNQNAFWLVLSKHQLDALDLSQVSTPWSIKYAELQDITSKNETLEIPAFHLGYSFNLPNPLTLRANSLGNIGSSQEIIWELNTNSPILGVYQILRGSRLIKIKMNENMEKSLNTIRILQFDNTIFGVYDFKKDNQKEGQITFTNLKAFQIATSYINGARFHETIMPLLNISNALDISRHDTLLRHFPTRKYNQHKNNGFHNIADPTPHISKWSTLATIFGVSIYFIIVFALGMACFTKDSTIPQKPKNIGIDIGTETCNFPFENPISPESSPKSTKITTTEKEHAKMNVLKAGQLQIFTNKILGYGSLGTIVYKGIFSGRSVAVKRLLRPFHDVAVKEISALIDSDNHPNVIRYFVKEEDAEFIYIALEKCAGSFDQLIELSAQPTISNPPITPPPISSSSPPDSPDHSPLSAPPNRNLNTRMEKLFPPNERTPQLLLKLFTESMKGLCFLHENKIVHRDLKPQNILISKLKHAKVSDMGLCKKLNNIEHSFETNASGTWGWQPAEVLAGQKRHSAIDIFSMGCILYYALTGGKHPFGDKFSRERNILHGKFDLSDLNNKNDKWFTAQHLIENMIAFDYSKRPNATDCMNHILFWDSEKRLNFLCEVSNKIEYDFGKNQTEGKLIIGFEKIASKFKLLNHCGLKWSNLIDKTIMQELNKHRKKYDATYASDLIRVFFI